MRRRYGLGEFEEVVMLAVGVLFPEAYGVSIKRELEGRLNRGISVGALQSALRRLEKKGFLRSELGDATAQRGGRRKCFFYITAFGKKVLQETRETRKQLWNDIPDIALDF